VNQFSLTVELEVSPAVLRFHLARVVAALDVPLEVEKPLRLKLGHLRSGRVEALVLTSGAVHLEAAFEGGLGLKLDLTEVRLDVDAQILHVTLERLTPRGFVGAALVNPLRGALLSGATKAANARVPDLLRGVRGASLEVNLNALTQRVLEDEKLRDGLARALPLEGQTGLRVLGLEVRETGLWVRLSAAG
jgi:hypothetical protein